ncbi:hypothetical protein Aperf_G00000074284 [Anoplocephala perfoliata]
MKVVLFVFLLFHVVVCSPLSYFGCDRNCRNEYGTAVLSSKTSWLGFLDNLSFSRIYNFFGLNIETAKPSAAEEIQARNVVTGGPVNESLVRGAKGIGVTENVTQDSDIRHSSVTQMPSGIDGTDAFNITSIAGEFCSRAKAALYRLATHPLFIILIFVMTLSILIFACSRPSFRPIRAFVLQRQYVRFA